MFSFSRTPSLFRSVSPLAVVRQARGFSYSTRSANTIQDLQNAFKDPTSPFHLAPGQAGPDSPNAPVNPETIGGSESDLSGSHAQSLREGSELLVRKGFDPASFWEQPIVWGDMDSFQHVNNVHYVRYFESGRMQWLRSIMHELGGPDRVSAMLKGQGISFILKSISIRYKRPVTYPDTLLIAHKPHLPTITSRDTDNWPRKAFNLAGAAWSCTQRTMVTDSDSEIVWFDYDTQKKCDPGSENRQAIWKRVAWALDQEDARKNVGK